MKKVKPPTLQNKGFEDDHLIEKSDDSAGEELDNHGKENKYLTQSYISSLTSKKSKK